MTNTQHVEVTEFQTLCTTGDENVAPALGKFHIIVRSISFDPLESDQSLIPLFIACSAVKRNNKSKTAYRFSSASETSPMLASLKYLAKCAAVTHIYAFPRSAADRQDAWKQLAASTSENTDSGATVIASNLRCCHRLADTESHHISMVLCTRHPMCGIVDGHEVSVAKLASAAHSLQYGAWNLLQKELLMGFRLNDSFWKMLGTLQDALGEKSPGYWYLMHPNNYDTLNAWRSAYINVVNPHLFNDDASVKKQPAEQFIKHAINFRNHIYTLMQVCSGGPARATEAAVLRIRNTAKATRGIFVLEGQLHTILTYSKTRSLQDGTGRAIVRCPDAVTAGLMHIYLLFIHPLQLMLSVQIADHQNSDTGAKPHSCSLPPPIQPSAQTTNTVQTANSLDFIFDPSSTDSLRTAFTSCLSSVDIPLNTTQYRHYHSAVLKNFLPSAAAAIQTGDEHSGATSISATMHLQAGHTEHTATKTYGVTRSQLTALTATELQLFRNASQTWHHAIRLPTGCTISFEEKPNPSTLSTGKSSEQQQQHQHTLKQ